MVFIQILYNFHIYKVFDLLHLNDFNVIDNFNVFNIALLLVINRFEILITVIIIAHLIIAKAFRRFAIISEYRPYYINIKDAITFISLRINKYYNVYY